MRKGALQNVGWQPLCLDRRTVLFKQSVSAWLKPPGGADHGPARRFAYCRIRWVIARPGREACGVTIAHVHWHLTVEAIAGVDRSRLSGLDREAGRTGPSIRRENRALRLRSVRAGAGGLDRYGRRPANRTRACSAKGRGAWVECDRDCRGPVNGPR